MFAQQLRIESQRCGTSLRMRQLWPPLTWSTADAVSDLYHFFASDGEFQLLNTWLRGVESSYVSWGQPTDTPFTLISPAFCSCPAFTFGVLISGSHDVVCLFCVHNYNPC